MKNRFTLFILLTLILTGLNYAQPLVTTVIVSSSGNDVVYVSGGTGITLGLDALPIIHKGVCWNIYGSPTSPTLSDAHTDDGTGSADYSSILTGLSAGTSYNYCAYVDNGTDPVMYGSTLSFTIPPSLTAPATFAVGQSVLPLLQWSSVTGATSYELQFSTANDFSSPISLSPAYNTTDAFYQFTFVNTSSTVLANGTRYYWRVRVTTGAGVSRWSIGGDFTTVAASTPSFTVLSPSGTSLTLYWNSYPYSAGLKYDLYQSDFSNMSSAATVVASTTNSYATLDNLIPGHTYYYMVRSKNSAGTVINSYSAVQQYDVPGLPIPYASYPTASVTDYFNPPAFYWYLGVYYPNLKFVVKYWRDDILPGSVTYPTAQTASSGFFYSNSINYAAALTATLTAGATYHWQVASTNDNGVTYGSLSVIADFVVYSSVPATAPKPYLSWPVGGNTNYLNPPTFYWYTGTYATGLEFFVEWDDNNTFNNADPHYGSSGGTWLTNLYYTVGSNLGSGTWYWRVTCRLAANHASTFASDYDTFVIPASLSSVAVPYPTAPVGGLEVPSLNPTLSWFALTPPALTYRIRISPYSDVDLNGVLNHVTVQQSGWVSGTSSTFNALSLASPLVAGAIYYWQVQASTDGGTTVSSWSYIASFSTAAGASLVVPFAVSPIKGQPINTSSVVLTWAAPTAIDNHLKYDLEYSKNPNFSNSLVITDINEPFKKIDGLDKNSQYYWRVVSKTSHDKSNSSTVANFKTINGTTDVANNQIIPDKYELSQNYPNPFNPSTKISFSLPKSSIVTVKIYDMLGREVKTLINNEMPAGVHSLEWRGENNNGSMVASGTYIYRINAGEFIATKKMVFLK